MAVEIKSIDELIEGQILGKTLFDENGNELLAEGTKLSERMINKLENMGIEYVHIFDNVINLFDNKKEKEKEARFYESTEKTRIV